MLKTSGVPKGNSCGKGGRGLLDRLAMAEGQGSGSNTDYDGGYGQPGPLGSH